MSLTMACPECGTRVSNVLDSRASVGRVRRRRECLAGHRFTTYETNENDLDVMREQLRLVKAQAAIGTRLAADLASLLGRAD